MGVTLIVPPKVPKVKLDGRLIRDALLSLLDEERAFIITDPEPGEHKIFSFQRRNSTSLVEYDYETIPE